MALPFTLKSILRQKIMEIQNFHHAKIQSSKKSLQFTKTKVNKLNDETRTKHEPT